MTRFLIVVLTALGPGALWAQPRAPQEFQVTLAGSPIVLDGRLDEPAWQQAVPIPLKYEYFPGDNTPAAVETLCFVTYDRDKLYVGCRAADPDMSALRANLADRDVPRNDDTIGFMIDTFNDGRRAFQFRVNPRGVQMDAFNSDVDDSEDWSWDAIWDAKAQIGENGYTVEIAVPFSSLRFPRVSGVQTWGFMAMRDWPRSTRLRMRSSYVDRNRTCLVCQIRQVVGLRGDHARPEPRIRSDVDRGAQRCARGGASWSAWREYRAACCRQCRSAGRSVGALEPDAERRPERHGQSGLLPGGGRRCAAERERSVSALLSRDGGRFFSRARISSRRRSAPCSPERSPIPISG